jgi:ribose transport system permease protein
MTQSTERHSAGTAAPTGRLRRGGTQQQPMANVFKRLGLERFALIGVWILLIIVFSILRPSTFPTAGNLQTILGSQAVQAVVALALLLPLITGDYDLSVASTASLSAMTVTVLNVNEGWPILLAIVAGVLVGALVGLVNGSLSALLGLDPFIITLGMGTLLIGVVSWISSDLTISGIDQGLVNAMIVDRLFGVPAEFYYGAVICALLWYLFEFTPLGRRLLYVGRSRDVARLSGIRVSRLRLAAFIGSGTLSAIAGVMYAGTLGGANPSSGTDLLLPAFAAVFLGATCISPGRFNPWGTLIAVYFLVTGITGLQLLGAQSYVQSLFSGGALIVAVTVSFLVRRRAAARTSVNDRTAAVPLEGSATELATNDEDL